MKITQSSVGYNADLQKELSVIDGSPFQLQDNSLLIERRQIKPGLITSLLNAMSMEETFRTDTFAYDETNWGAQLPDGKAYSAKTTDIEKEQPRRLNFAIPSFGLRSNVAPQDYIGRRKPGTTNDLLTETDVEAQMSIKAMQAWDLFDELAWSTLLTTDTNITRGGPFTSYNFWNSIVDVDLPTFSDLTATRPAPVSMQLGSTGVDHIQLFRAQRKLLEQGLARAQDSASAFVCICGDNFYDQRYEIQKKEGLARPVIQNTDLASAAVGTINVGGFDYDTFKSEDGIQYINYGSEIISGTKLIGDDLAFLLPVGANKIVRKAFAPSQTRTYANTEALSMYTWSFADEFSGLTQMQESNALFALINPQLITHLTV
jgi:hypothetical protein